MVPRIRSVPMRGRIFFGATSNVQRLTSNGFSPGPGPCGLSSLATGGRYEPTTVRMDDGTTRQRYDLTKVGINALTRLRSYARTHARSSLNPEL